MGVWNDEEGVKKNWKQEKIFLVLPVLIFYNKNKFFNKVFNVRPRAGFHCGVFRNPKNGALDLIKLGIEIILTLEKLDIRSRFT